MSADKDTYICFVCNKQYAVRDIVPAPIIRPGVAELIRKKFPAWNDNCFICQQDLNEFRGEYVEDVLLEERGELSQLEEEVIRSFREQELLTENIEAQFDRTITTGEHVADKVAEFGGSWTFIILFAVILLTWVAVNSVGLFAKPFDPFPFIFLNLILSCLAAIQAPVIMMSQNRQEAKDRMRADHDYRINLKAELEIRHLNAKLDLLLTHQWQRLLEIQQVQTDLIKELADRDNSRQ